jgi:hypothetical protein
VAANFFAVICVISAFFLLMEQHFIAAIQGIASAVRFGLASFLIKVLSDIRWHLERMSKT